MSTTVTSSRHLPRNLLTSLSYRRNSPQPSSSVSLISSSGAGSRNRSLLLSHQRKYYHRIIQEAAIRISLTSRLTPSFIYTENQQQKNYFHSSSLLCNDAAAAASAGTEDSPTVDTAVEEEQFVELPRPILSKESEEKVDKIFRKVVYCDVIEIHLLTELINKRLGSEMTAADYERMAAGGGASFGFGGGGGSSDAGAGGGEEADKKEEKTAFDLKITGFDAKAKIKVIKEVRSIAGLGLKEAKELVEGAASGDGKILKKDIKQEEADELKAKLEEVGATVEIV